jgi:hypothetical protein
MLVHNAQEVLLKSWSIRLNVLLGLISAFTTALPLWNADYEWFSPTNLFAIATFASTAIAVVLRVIDQGLSPKPEGPTLIDTYRGELGIG